MIWRIVSLSAIHFVAWFGSAMVAFGTDLDQLSSRSVVATAFAPVCAVLQYPHDVLLRALPMAWLQQVPQISLAVVMLSSVLWGIALFGAWRLSRTLSKRITTARGEHAA